MNYDDSYTRKQRSMQMIRGEHGCRCALSLLASCWETNGQSYGCACARRRVTYSYNMCHAQAALITFYTHYIHVFTIKFMGPNDAHIGALKIFRLKIL